MKAKKEKHLTRAREERGDACPNSPENHTRPVIASAIHPMAVSTLPPQRKTMRLRIFRCSKQGAAVCYKRKAFVLFISMRGQRVIVPGLSSLEPLRWGTAALEQPGNVGKLKLSILVCGFCEMSYLCRAYELTNYFTVNAPCRGACACTQHIVFLQSSNHDKQVIRS